MGFPSRGSRSWNLPASQHLERLSAGCRALKRRAPLPDYVHTAGCGLYCSCCSGCLLCPGRSQPQALSCTDSQQRLWESSSALAGERGRELVLSLGGLLCPHSPLQTPRSCPSQAGYVPGLSPAAVICTLDSWWRQNNCQSQLQPADYQEKALSRVCCTSTLPYPQLSALEDGRPGWSTAHQSSTLTELQVKWNERDWKALKHLNAHQQMNG